MDHNYSGFKDLIEKYRQNTLSPEELTRLREMVNTVSDSELLGLLDENGAPDESTHDYSESIVRIKNSLDRRIAAHNSAPASRVWIYSSAAALLAACIVTVCFLIFSPEATDHPGYCNSTVSTLGKDTYITLCDSSVVRLRSGSSIEYPQNFGSDDRQISFEGEGFFDIAPMDGKPFVINAPGLSISVKGTSFGVVAGSNLDCTSVSLFEGTVDLTSTRSNERITLTSGNIATLDTGNGHFTVRSMNPDIQIDWKNNEIHCLNVNPDTLIRQFEQHYDVALSPGIKKAIDGNFTGTLPFDDLNGALKVLGKVYGFGSFGINVNDSEAENADML
ncbi:MAG: FecR family protein [Muribaculaceae bacterium]|nr:FecR family protein [Muribaculaceae bacterium]